MLEFRPRKRPRNYFSRREQLRLLLGVGVVGIAVIALAGGRSDHWVWLLQGGAPPSDAADPIDTRIQPPAQSDGLVAVSLSRPDSTVPADSTGRYFPGVKPALLDAVRDDTVRFRGDSDAWSHLMHVLEETQPSKLAAASTGKVSFVQLFQQPAAYRGELVTVVGTVHWAHSVTAPSNEHGIEKYFQLWIEPHGAGLPMAIDCLELPAGFPRGKGLREPVQVTGFFFKRMGYGSNDGMRTAPLMLASTVDWTPQPVAADDDDSHWIVNVLILATVAGTIVLGLLMARQNKHSPSALRLQARPDQLRALSQEEVLPDVETSLNQLSRGPDRDRL